MAEHFVIGTGLSELIETGGAEDWRMLDQLTADPELMMAEAMDILEHDRNGLVDIATALTIHPTLTARVCREILAAA
jgi:hypothetical protein